MFHCLENNNIVAIGEKFKVLMKYEQYFVFSSKLLTLLVLVLFLLKYV